jgi:hypothetical protein
MANDYTVIKAADGNVVVVLHRECKISRDEILALLRELGFDTASVTFLEPGEVEDCKHLSGTPVIIPVDGATCDLPELAEAGRQCGTAGGRVIVLCGPDFSYDGLHPIAEKYGTQCGWSPDQLKVRVAGQTNEPCSPSGGGKKRTGTSQVDC